jgi:hypothetical protein
MPPAASIAQQTFVTAAPAVSANLYYAADESHKQVRTCRSSQLQQPAAALYFTCTPGSRKQLFHLTKSHGSSSQQHEIKELQGQL